MAVRVCGRVFRGLLTLFLLSAATASAQSVDNELWLDQSFSFTLSPKTALQLQLAERMNRNASHLFQTFVQAGLAFKPRRWLTLTPTVRHDRLNPFDNTSTYENRVFLEVILQTRRGRWRPNLRTRFEGRFFEHQEGFFRWRIRPGVQYALRGGASRSPALVVSDELFFDTRDDRYNRNRVLGGVSVPLSHHFSLMPYYALESNRLPTLWDHDNIWGLSLAWSF